MPPILRTVARNSTRPTCPGSLAALDAMPGVGTAHRAPVLAHVPTGGLRLARIGRAGDHHGVPSRVCVSVPPYRQENCIRGHNQLHSAHLTPPPPSTGLEDAGTTGALALRRVHLQKHSKHHDQREDAHGCSTSEFPPRPYRRWGPRKVGSGGPPVPKWVAPTRMPLPYLIPPTAKPATGVPASGV